MVIGGDGDNWRETLAAARDRLCLAPTGLASFIDASHCSDQSREARTAVDDCVVLDLDQ